MKKLELDKHSGDGLNDWFNAPIRTAWGHGMMECNVALCKDATLSLYCHRTEVHLVRDALRKGLGVEAEEVAHKRELQAQQHATQDIAMAASIKLATARMIILKALQSGKLDTELTMALSAVVDVLPAPKTPQSTPDPHMLEDIRRALLPRP